MSNSNFDVIVIGNILKETIVYPDRSIGPVLGSPCAYTGLVMAKLGLKVGMVSYYGNDYPEDLIRELRLVDQTGFLYHTYSTVNHLIYREDGTKTVEYYKTAPVIQYSDIPKEYENAALYYICPMNYEVSIELSICLKEAGQTIMLDLGGYGGTTVYNRFTIDTPRGNYYIRSLCQVANIIKVSEEDLSLIMPALNVEASAQKLIDFGAETIVITRGEKGALYQRKDSAIHYIPAAKPRLSEDALNVVGAGDAFAGGFICKYLENKNVQDAVVYGNAVASLLMEKEGACVESRMPGQELADLRRDGII